MQSSALIESDAFIEAVVIMAVKDLDSLEATLELLRDPAAQRRIAESESEIARGEWLDEAALRVYVLDIDHRRDAYR